MSLLKQIREKTAPKHPLAGEGIQTRTAYLSILACVAYHDNQSFEPKELEILADFAQKLDLKDNLESVVEMTPNVDFEGLESLVEFVDQFAWHKQIFEDFEAVLMADDVVSDTENELKSALQGMFKDKEKPASRFGSFTDPRDGQVYKTVKIGNQVWMAENLNYKINDGYGSWCYDNNLINGKMYGRLYNWETALKAPPQGWRLPTVEEWAELESFIGFPPGSKLKAHIKWKGTDEFGFSALPAGCCIDSNRFDGKGDYTRFWTSTVAQIGRKAWYQGLSKESMTIYHNDGPQERFFSVRCIKNKD